jgi:hypothetical protein
MSQFQSHFNRDDAAAVALGSASRDAKALALGFGGSYLTPSQTINALAVSASEFRKTFQAFAEMLTQDESSIEFFDEFAQTWDECSDFLYDYDRLRRGVAFAKRQPPVPAPAHRLARYVYTDKEIDRLRRRIELQHYIMLAKLDERQDAQSLEKFSAAKWKNLLETYWAFRDEAPILTRKRAYARDDRYDGTTSSFPSLPASALSFEFDTTM